MVNSLHDSINITNIKLVMIKEILLEHFYKSDCIINHDNLVRYIEFCLKNDRVRKIKGETTSHHILPRAKRLPWQEYKNLVEYPWNKSELTYYDHYYAHYLLSLSIDHISIQSAFCGMHKKDVNLGRISESELIGKDEFEHQYKKRNELISKDRLTLITNDAGIVMTKAKMIHLRTDWTNSKRISSERMLGVDNPSNNPVVIAKTRNTKSLISNEGKSLDTISAERAAEVMKKEFVNGEGEITTIYKETGKKLSHILRTTDLATRRADVRRERYYQNCPMVIVRNALDESYVSIMSLNEARKLSPGIDKKTKHNYLGKTTFGRNKFIKDNKAHLIGLYAERLPIEV